MECPVKGKGWQSRSGSYLGHGVVESRADAHVEVTTSPLELDKESWHWSIAALIILSSLLIT